MCPTKNNCMCFMVRGIFFFFMYNWSPWIKQEILKLQPQEPMICSNGGVKECDVPKPSVIEWSSHPDIKNRQEMEISYDNKDNKEVWWRNKNLSLD